MSPFLPEKGHASLSLIKTSNRRTLSSSCAGPLTGRLKIITTKIPVGTDGSFFWSLDAQNKISIQYNIDKIIHKYHIDQEIYLCILTISIDLWENYIVSAFLCQCFVTFRRLPFCKHTNQSSQLQFDKWDWFVIKSNVTKCRTLFIQEPCNLYSNYALTPKSNPNLHSVIRRSCNRNLMDLGSSSLNPLFSNSIFFQWNTVVTTY